MFLFNKLKGIATRENEDEVNFLQMSTTPDSPLTTLEKQTDVYERAFVGQLSPEYGFNGAQKLEGNCSKDDNFKMELGFSKESTTCPYEDKRLEDVHVQHDDDDNQIEKEYDDDDQFEEEDGSQSVNKEVQNQRSICEGRDLVDQNDSDRNIQSEKEVSYENASDQSEDCVVVGLNQTPELQITNTINVNDEYEILNSNSILVLDENEAVEMEDDDNEFDVSSSEGSESSEDSDSLLIQNSWDGDSESCEDSSSSSDSEEFVESISIGEDLSRNINSDSEDKVMKNHSLVWDSQEQSNLNNSQVFNSIEQGPINNSQVFDSLEQSPIDNIPVCASREQLPIDSPQVCASVEQSPIERVCASHEQILTDSSKVYASHELSLIDSSQVLASYNPFDMNNMNVCDSHKESNIDDSQVVRDSHGQLDADNSQDSCEESNIDNSPVVRDLHGQSDADNSQDSWEESNIDNSQIVRDLHGQSDADNSQDSCEESSTDNSQSFDSPEQLDKSSLQISDGVGEAGYVPIHHNIRNFDSRLDSFSFVDEDGGNISESDGDLIERNTSPKEFLIMDNLHAMGYLETHDASVPVSDSEKDLKILSSLQDVTIDQKNMASENIRVNIASDKSMESVKPKSGNNYSLSLEQAQVSSAICNELVSHPHYKTELIDEEYIPENHSQKLFCLESCLNPYPCYTHSPCLYNQLGKLCRIFGNRYLYVDLGHLGAPILISVDGKISPFKDFQDCNVVWRGNTPIDLYELDDGTEIMFDAIVLPELKRYVPIAMWHTSKPEAVIFPKRGSLMFLEEVSGFCVSFISYNEKNKGVAKATINGKSMNINFSIEVVYLSGKRVSSKTEMMLLFGVPEAQIYISANKFKRTEPPFEYIYITSCIWNGPKPNGLLLKPSLSQGDVYVTHNSSCQLPAKARYSIVYCDVPCELSLNLTDGKPSADENEYTLKFILDNDMKSIKCTADTLYFGNECVSLVDSSNLPTTVNVKAHILKQKLKSEDKIVCAIMVQLPMECVANDLAERVIEPSETNDSSMNSSHGVSLLSLLDDTSSTLTNKSSIDMKKPSPVPCKTPIDCPKKDNIGSTNPFTVSRINNQQCKILSNRDTSPALNQIPNPSSRLDTSACSSSNKNDLEQCSGLSNNRKFSQSSEAISLSSDKTTEIHKVDNCKAQIENMSPIHRNQSIPSSENNIFMNIGSSSLPIVSNTSSECSSAEDYYSPAYGSPTTTDSFPTSFQISNVEGHKKRPVSESGQLSDATSDASTNKTVKQHPRTRGSLSLGSLSCVSRSGSNNSIDRSKNGSSSLTLLNDTSERSHHLNKQQNLVSSSCNDISKQKEKAISSSIPSKTLTQSKFKGENPSNPSLDIWLKTRASISEKHDVPKFNTNTTVTKAVIPKQLSCTETSQPIVPNVPVPSLFNAFKQENMPRHLTNTTASKVVVPKQLSWGTTNQPGVPKQFSWATTNQLVVPKLLSSAITNQPVKPNVPAPNLFATNKLVSNIDVKITKPPISQKPSVTPVKTRTAKSSKEEIYFASCTIVKNSRNSTFVKPTGQNLNVKNPYAQIHNELICLNGHFLKTENDFKSAIEPYMKKTWNCLIQKCRAQTISEINVHFKGCLMWYGQVPTKKYNTILMKSHIVNVDFLTSTSVKVEPKVPTLINSRSQLGSNISDGKISKPLIAQKPSVTAKSSKEEIYFAYCTIVKICPNSTFVKPTGQNLNVEDPFAQIHNELIFLNGNFLKGEEDFKSAIEPYMEKTWSCFIQKCTTQTISDIKVHFTGCLMWYGKEPTDKCNEILMKSRIVNLNPPTSPSPVKGKQNVPMLINSSCDQTKSAGKDTPMTGTIKMLKPDYVTINFGSPARASESTVTHHRRVCYLYNVCLESINLTEVLAVGLPVEKMKKIYIGNTYADAESQDRATCYYLISAWCHKYDVPLETKEKLLLAVGWLPPELDPTASTLSSKGMMNLI